MRGLIAVGLMIMGTSGQADTPAQVLSDLMSAPPEAAQFAPAFLAEVPISQLIPFLDQIRAQIGPVDRIEPDGDGFRIETATHAVSAQITLNAEGQVAGLFFQPPEARATTLDAALVALDALPGQVAYHITTNGAVVADQGGNAPVQVASAFKIAVFAELLAQGRDLADVVTVEPRHHSLPSGRMQHLPSGAPVTLYAAAAEMIAESDNTATDLLLDVVGADAVAERLGLDRVLTTRQLFQLKADADLAALYGTDPDSALEALADRGLPAVADVLGLTGPDDPGWTVPLRKLCEIMESVSYHPIMKINPGPVRRSDWTQVAYKGGSDAGVIAFVHHLTASDGTRHCAAMAIAADEPVEEGPAVAAWRTTLSVLAETTR